MIRDHKTIEKSIFLLLVGVIIVTSIGAMVQILPLFIKEVTIEKVEGMRPYTPLELIGFNIYKSEGCYNCHSQQIRPLRDEVERYGHYSLAAESMYDYPFQWGSKRTGPDLARVGGRYSDDWHVEHLINPRSLVPASIMPAYSFLAKSELNTADIVAQMQIYRKLGVPYDEESIQKALEDIKVQLGMIDDSAAIESFQRRYPKAVIRKFNPKTEVATQMDALVGYLQSLGNKVELETNQGRTW
jgi:cytochrome c oxidase cbb3-type subunit 2